MSTVDARTELMIEKRITASEKFFKREIHKSNDRTQTQISEQYNHFDDKVDKLHNDNAVILLEIDKLYSKKWVERTIISVGVFVIMGVSTIIWNIFNEKLTLLLEGMIK